MKNGALEINGLEYRWSILREQTWVTGEGPVGVAVLVESESGGRELVLQFDGIVGHRCTPNHVRFRIPNRRLIEAISEATASGWDPDSRGKRYIFQAGPV